MTNFEMKWNGFPEMEVVDEKNPFLIRGMVEPRPYLKTAVKAYREMGYGGTESDLSGFWGERFKSICGRGYVGVPYPTFSALTLDQLLLFASKLWCQHYSTEFDTKQRQVLYAVWKDHFGQFMDQKGLEPERLRFLYQCGMSNTDENNPFLFGLNQAYDTHSSYGCKEYEDSQYYLASQLVKEIDKIEGVKGLTMTARDFVILLILGLTEKIYFPEAKNGYSEALDRLIWGWFREILPLKKAKNTASGRGPGDCVPYFRAFGGLRLRLDGGSGYAGDRYGFGGLGEEVLKA
jgi:hypothetical protein